ncbi:MFS transporter [Paracoccus aminophilus]|uniref:MFS transporter n=1 Tax=Paracoccus aminophilus JCM 7686 TaxID=1367847 RepID=S5XJS0_PARAH|nr:MFS transporter [Paracoccus aminophilus]AGT07434.1 MFS transporter [Paracoccus aminophilus JCM 7686]
MAVLDKKRIWGWWFFDWASQPYSTLLMTFIFPIYFTEAARAHFTALGQSPAEAGASAQSLWGYGLAIAGICIAVLAPILGSVADAAGRRLIWVWFFSIFYVLGSGALWFLTPAGDNLILVVAAFGIGLIAMEFTTIFTNALLPGLAPRAEIGRVSGTGFAFGYLGGVVSLAVMLLFFAENTQTGRTLIGLAPAFGLDPTLREGTRAAGPLTAIWYIVFMLPFLFWVKEPRSASNTRAASGIRPALRSLWTLLKSLRHRRSLTAWLISSMFSRDALNGLYAFGGVYAAAVLGWPVFLAGVFGIVSAFSAALITWLGGRADQRWGPRPVIAVCSVVLIAVCLIVIGMSRESFFGLTIPPGSKLPDAIFFACGIAIGGAGGALQSASRTMMVHHTTPEQATEAFGLYALSGKATAFLAPLLIAVATDLSGNQQIGISPLIVMFIFSLLLLTRVKPEGEPEQ